MRRWWLAFFNVVWVARGLPSALLAEVAELLREGRDFVVAQDAFEAARTHDRFERYCEEHLRAAGDAAPANKSTAAARSVLLEACAAESDAWDRREHLRDQEVHVLETALALLHSPAVEEESAASAFLQLAAHNRTMREEARLCQEDLDQVSKLKLHLEKKVNQTAAAVAQVSARVETGRQNVSGVKRAARQTVDRILGWDQSYGEQEARLAEQETAKAGAARAVGEATELLANFYTQPQAGTLTQLLGAGSSEAPDLEALRDDTAWPANLLQVWPDCPERPAPYALHHALANKVLAVLQTLSRVMQADADGTKHVAESVQAEARRVRGFRGRAAHETREHLARLKQDIKESDQALVVLKDRQHTEATQLQAVLDKMAQLQELCARVTAAQPKRLDA